MYLVSVAFSTGKSLPSIVNKYYGVPGDPKASFTKEEMHAGLHQVYERKLHNQLLASQRDSSNNSSGMLPFSQRGTPISF